MWIYKIMTLKEIKLIQQFLLIKDPAKKTKIKKK